MSANFNNLGNSFGGFVDCTGAEWCIGIWQQGNATNLGSGFIFQAVPLSYANYATALSSANQLSLVDAGNGLASLYDRRKYILNGSDSAGARIGSRTISVNGANMYGIQAAQQYETGQTFRTLLVSQRRAGVTELWMCRPGCTAVLLASETKSFAGMNGTLGMSIGISRYSSSEPYKHNLDAPFHFSDKALSAAEIERIASGESPNDIDKTRAATATLSFVSITSTSYNDTSTNWNPTAGTTLTVNGVVFTFVASGATGNQINIGAAYTDTVTNIAAVLSASVDPLVSVATYVTYGGGGLLRITHKTAGTVGESFTLASSSANIRIPLSGKLGYVVWNYPSLSSSVPNQALNGGGLLIRFQLGGWGTAGPAIADTTAKPNAVRVSGFGPGRVIQHISGVANIALSGTYSGADPAGISASVVNLSDSSTVLAESALTNFTASGGTWSGTLNNVPKGKRWLGLKMRKTGGADYTQTEIPWGVGEVVEIAGQSLGNIWRAGLNLYAANGYVSSYMSADYTDTTAYTSTLFAPDASWHRQMSQAESMQLTAKMGNAISEQTDCVVGVFNRCMGGTSVATINGTSQWSKRAVDFATSGCQGVGWMIWIHGHADSNSATYGNDLDSVVANCQSYYANTTKFGLLLVSNVQGSVDDTGAMWRMRKQQDDWVKSRSVANPKVFSAGQITDLALPGDGVHPDNVEALKMAERVTRAMLYKLGVSTLTADGPRLQSVKRTGAVVDLTFGIEGPYTLATVGNVAPSGFDVSADNFSTLLTISTTEIVLPNIVRITLAADPGVDVKVFHLWGRPGKVSGETSATQNWPVAQATPLYDTSPSILGLAFGKPAQSNFVAMSSILALINGAALLI